MERLGSHGLQRRDGTKNNRSATPTNPTGKQDNGELPDRSRESMSVHRIAYQCICFTEEIRALPRYECGSALYGLRMVMRCTEEHTIESRVTIGNVPGKTPVLFTNTERIIGKERHRMPVRPSIALYANGTNGENTVWNRNRCHGDLFLTKTP